MKNKAFSKILLHSWSLFIEWQFYVLYPILLMLLFKTTKQNALSSYLGKDGVIARLDNREYLLSLQQFRDQYEGHAGVYDAKGEVFLNSNGGEL